MASERTGKELLKDFLFLIIRTALIILAFAATVKFVLTPYRMTGNSMYPAIKDGDLGFFYQLNEPFIGDVVLYEAPDGTVKLGRVVAAGGQSIDFPSTGGFLVNGYQPAEEIMYDTYSVVGSKVRYPMVLAEDTYFVLNDYRSETGDSRWYGAIPERRIIGKLMILIRRRSF